jgi:pimeloyl-ACP methyl ester carboxylesterase
MKKLFYVFVLFVYCSITFAQSGVGQDSTLNNLVHPDGYKTSEYGAIPHYAKAGKGKRTMIMIPGLGFDESVFSDFVKSNKRNYTMYVITIPGFGKAPAAPMPKPGTSYGDQPWNKGILEGINKLIETEKLDQPIIVGHFTQGTQLALRMAIDFPDKVGGVLILGGVAKFVAIQNGKPMQVPLKGAIYYTDKISAPKFYKTVTESYWDQNNYMRELYSLQPELSDKLWQQVAAVPLPVMIQYLLEFHASDITLEAEKIKCPVLVLRPGFKTVFFENPENGTMNYIKPQFIDSWNDMQKRNSLIEIQDVPNSATFLWKDQPEETSRRIKQFVDEKVAVKK